MKFTERDLGRWLPKEWAADREEEMARQLEARQALWRVALMAALRKRESFGRKLYFNEGIGLEDWPELEPLTAVERTLIIRELRKMLNTPAEVRSK